MNFSFWCRRKRRLIPPSFLPASSFGSFQYIPVSWWTGRIDTDMVANGFGNRFTSHLLYEIVLKLRRHIAILYQLNMEWAFVPYSKWKFSEYMRNTSRTQWWVLCHNQLFEEFTAYCCQPLTNLYLLSHQWLQVQAETQIVFALAEMSPLTPQYPASEHPWLKTVSNIYKANSYATHAREI